jgi:hypothetical protein
LDCQIKQNGVRLHLINKNHNNPRVMKKLLLKSEKSILLIFLLVVTSISRGQSTQTYTTPGGTFATPAGISTIQVEAYGAGGGGGYGGTFNRNGGGGGGGGGYTINSSVTVVGGTSYPITVGAGGSGSANSSSNGANGNQTTATFSSTVTATGGNGGKRYSAGGNGGGGGNGTRNGGTGGTGTSSGSGGGGGAAGSSAGGNGGLPTAGASGGLLAGAGGAGNTSSAVAGNDGNNYGGGGAGGTRNSRGGDGADGFMKITYTCPTYALTSTTSSNMCGSAAATVNLSGSAASLGAGTYTVTYNLSGATTATGITASMTVTTAGSGSFATSILNVGTTNITITNLTSSYCSNTISTNNSASVIVTAVPDAIAGSNITTCAIAGAINITAGASAINATGGITWTSSGTGTFVNQNSLLSCTYTPSAADILAGSVTITLTAVGGTPCSNDVSNKTLTIYSPMTVFAGGSLTSCGSSPISVTSGCSATNATSTTWSTSGTGTFSNASSLTTCTYTASAADIAAGSVTITLTGSNAACPNVTSSKTITINGSATAVAGTTINTCAATGAVNITTGSSATNYSSVLWTSSGTGTLTNANSLTTCTYTPSAAENTAGSTITLTLTAYGISPCGNVTSNKSLVISRAMTSVAGTAVTMCSSSASVNITAGSSATNQTSVTWTSSGTGTFTNANSLTTCTYIPSAADKTAGSVTLTLTATNAGCPPVVSTKTLTITAAATSNAGSTINTCSTTGAVNITTGSSATNNSSILWTSNGTGTLTNATSLTLCTYTPSAAENTAGSTITLTLTSYGNSPCGNVTSNKSLVISRAMTVSAGSNQAVCYSSGSISLTGATATNHTGVTWTSSGTGTFTNPNSLGACSYTPSAADIVAGSVTITLTATNNGCSPAVSTKTLTISTTPTAVAGPAMTTCSTYGAANITAGSSATYQSSVLWTSSGTGTFTNATSLTTCTYTPSAADISAGSVTLTLTAYGNAPCGNTTSTKTLTITTTPTITGSTPGSRTGIGTVLLGATASGGATPTWYAASTGGTALGTGTSFTTPVISTTTTFYVEAVNGICSSTPRIAVVATVNYNEIDIQGNAISIVDGDTTPSVTDWTDFGTTNPTRTFTIRNTGAALLTVGTITFSGVNAGEFSVTTPPSATIAVGSSTTFVVTFAPTGVGLRTADISIVNNDTDENPYNFTLQGTGIEQEIDIKGNGVTIADGDMSPTTADWTDFSTVAGTRTFTIYNTGNVALTIGTITIGGANAADFSISTPPASTIAANSSTTFVVTFSPTAINTRTATISIVNNDNTENPYNFAIQGFGIIPEIDIQGNSTSIPDSTVPAATTANWTDFGSTNGTRTFTIYNNGNITLTVGAITFTGTNASEFTVTTPPAATVPAFSSTTFVVTFLPTATGTRSAVIHIINNDGTENPYDFNLQGTGVPREIDLQGLSLSIANADMVTSVNDGTDFGSADINLATITRTFIIRNTGTLALTISNPTISGANAADFSITANPGTLSIGAGGSTTFQVTFNPSAVFTRIAQINITNNDSDENPYYFAIQGTGLLDNDGDGIENNTDQDDDNDGIIDTIECGTCISDPFVNGSFEAPVIGTATYSIEPSANVTGWNNSAENVIEIWSTGFNGVPSAAGNQFAELNANVAGNLYQSFCLNGAGGSINWAIKHRGRSGTDTAQVRFGPDLASVATVATMTDGNTAWGSYSGTYTIPVGQTSIVLAFTAVSSTGGLSYGNFIDDVQIIINQNCIDTDGDSIANILDVDSDNDGIPDVEEGGFKAYSNNTGTMDKTNPANWKDLNGNGINDYIDTIIAGGTYSIPDTDGDGIPNYLDLDSDNDSLWDVDEANLLNGDGDINDDGKGDGADTEGDGLLNLFDNSTAFGSAYRAYAQDSDLNGISDYLQLDSNDDGTNDIQTGLYGSYDTNGDGRIDGSADADDDGIMDVLDTNDALRGSPRDLDRKLFLDFDGRNDYAEDSPILGGLSNATLMAWIDLNSAFNSTGVVVGQDRFHIRVTGSKILQAVVNGTILSYGTPLGTSQWCHVAATYANGYLTLYLNGKSVANVTLSGAISADASKLTLGKNPLTATNYFKGKIDEVRVFNVALSPTQLERMVYQEIQNNSSQVRGAIVPKDIGSLPWANLLKYYRMDTYKDDIVDNLTTGTVDTGTGMKLYNHKVINAQQAPMPFTTVRTGSFSSAVNDATKDIRGLDVLDFDYSIIQVNHDITETANSTDLALFINPGVTVNMTNDTKLQNEWYLLLNGKIDLAGKSQLIQTTNSDLDVTSTGSLERDQQGQSNKFNYNYWSSPVSSINNTTINHGFTIAGVMKDGTTATPQNLQWTTGINGSPTTPLTLSSYWIFKFQNSTNSYANWTSVGQNGTLLPGQGFTLKGGGAATSNQNYTFVGKPNTGAITSTVGANNLNLCGNPYPSAIDADEFIEDNLSSTTGTLYIWEHYSTNSSHNTIAYQGGYATYTKTGGTAPVAPSGVSGLGSSSKTPKRFIPVGQGFFVTGSTTGGTITFNNAQRLFVKEDDAVNSYTMFKSNNNTVLADTNPLMNNAQDEVIQEEFMKLRIGYNSTDNYHRQTLLGFMNENATSGYDAGYDGISIETLTNDMYFINGTDKLNINGDGYFNVNNIYPLGVKNATSGNVTFVVDNKENFDEDQEIYIFDNVTNTYNSIKSQSYEVNLPAGTYDNRFSLRFTNGTLGTSDNEDNHGIAVTHSQANNMINIKNALQEVTVKSVALYNLLGQQVTEWKINNQDQADIQLQVSDVSTGTYIVKVLTDGGNISKKILVKK